MNKIAIAGLLPFVYFSYIYNSHAMILIATNGFVFHSNPNNKIFYYIDFYTNASLFALASVKHPNVFKYSAFCFFVFLLNDKILKKKYKIICDIVHVIFVQWVGLYAMTVFHEKEPCGHLLFYC